MSELNSANRTTTEVPSASPSGDHYTGYVMRGSKVVLACDHKHQMYRTAIRCAKRKTKS